MQGQNKSAKVGLPSALLTKWKTPFDHWTAKLKKEFLPLEAYPNHLTEEKCIKMHAIYNDAVKETAEVERIVLARLTMLKRKRARASTSGWEQPAAPSPAKGVGGGAARVSSSQLGKGSKEKKPSKDKKKSAGKEDSTVSISPKKFSKKDKDKKITGSKRDREGDPSAGAGSSSSSSSNSSKKSKKKSRLDNDDGGERVRSSSSTGSGTGSAAKALSSSSSGVASALSSVSARGTGSAGTILKGTIPKSTMPKGMIPKKKKKKDEKSVPKWPAWLTRTPRAGDQVAVKVENEDLWILAKVEKCLSQNTFLVVDDDGDDEGGLGKHRQFKLKRSNILTFPRPEETSGKLFPEKTKVMALYPNTTTFYPATISRPFIEGRDGTGDSCVMQFQDDELTAEGILPDWTLPARFVRHPPPS